MDWYRKSEIATSHKTKKQVKFNLAQRFGRGKEIALNQTQISLILAQKIIRNLPNLKELNSLKESYLNKINFNSFYQIKCFIIDSLTEDLNEILYHIVLLSRTTELINLASSNAISFLNKSDFSFTNKDFSYIKIPNADLSNGMFIGTNFESSNLCGVNFSMAHLYDSNFKNCNMINADFGMKHQKLALRKAITCWGFSKCGRFIAFGIDKNIIIYNHKTYKQITLLIGHSFDVKKVLFSDNEVYLASWDGGYTLILWDIFSTHPIAIFEAKIEVFDFSPCNNYICLAWNTSIMYQNILKIYSIKSRQIVKEIDRVWLYLHWVMFSYNGEKLVILTRGSLSIWDISTENITHHKFYEYAWTRNASLDRKYIVLYNSPLDKIIVYSYEKFEAINALKSNSKSWWPPNCYFCGKYLVWESKKKEIKVVDFYSGDAVLELFPNKNWHNKVISLQNNQLVVGTSDKRYKLWKIPPRGEQNKKVLTRAKITMASFSQDCSFFAAVSEGWIFIFLTKSQKLLKRFQLPKQNIRCIAWSGNILATSGRTIIYIWDIYNGIPLKQIFPPHKLNFIEFSPDSKKLLYTANPDFAIWDIETDQVSSQLASSGVLTLGCHWSWCGNYILTTGSDKSIKIFNAKNLVLLEEIFNPDVKFDLMHLSPCGKYLLTCSFVKKVMIWHIEKDNKAKIVKEFYMKNLISSIVWSPDGKTTIIGDIRGKIMIQDFSEGNLSSTILAHKGTVKSLHFSTNENLLITGSQDKTIKLWDYDKFL